VRDIENLQQDTMLVRSTVGLGHSLGMLVIAGTSKPRPCSRSLAPR